MISFYLYVSFLGCCSVVVVANNNSEICVYSKDILYVISSIIYINGNNMETGKIYIRDCDMSIDLRPSRYHDIKTMTFIYV